MSIPLAMLPAPAATAAGGKKDDMAADIPAAIEIGIINVVGGYISKSGQAQEYQKLYKMSIPWEGRNLQSEAYKIHQP